MKSIRTKLILFIAAPTLIVYVAILGWTLSFLRARSFSELETTMTRLASNFAGRFDGYLREAAAVADTSATAFAANLHGPEVGFYSQLRANVEKRPFIYGACAAFEPGTVRPTSELFAPYVHRSGAAIAEMNISRGVYDWYGDPRWTWYREPKSLGRPVWSAPYFDEGAGNVLMTTYSAPFFVDGSIAGVATVDIDLTGLRESIGTGITEGADFVILAKDGAFVYDRRPERILRKTLKDVARESGNRELERILPLVLAGKAGVAVVPGWDHPERQWLFYSPIASTDWTFIAFTPERIALEGVRLRFIAAAAALAVTLAMIVTCIVLVSGLIVKPLSRLTANPDFSPWG